MIVLSIYIPLAEAFTVHSNSMLVASNRISTSHIGIFTIQLCFDERNFSTNSPIVSCSYCITVPQHGKRFHADIQSHLYDATNRTLVWMPAVPGAYAAGVPTKFLGCHQWAPGMLKFEYISLISYSHSWNFSRKLWAKFHNCRFCDCLEK